MVFVYRGSGKRQVESADVPAEQVMCKKKACAIQWCLSRNNHNQNKCEREIEEWQKCCDNVRNMKMEEAAAKAGNKSINESS